MLWCDRMGRDSKSVMSPELIGIVSVGLGLAGLILTGQSRTDARLTALGSRVAAVESRIGQVEQSVAVLLERTTPLAPVPAKTSK